MDEMDDSLEFGDVIKNPHRENRKMPDHDQKAERKFIRFTFVAVVVGVVVVGSASLWFGRAYLLAVFQ